MSKEFKILAGIAALVIAGGIALFFTSERTPQDSFNPYSLDPEHEAQLIREGSYMTGDANSKVTLVEFGDLQCPACAAAHPSVKQILAKYSSEELNYVFRHFPLSIHGNAPEAAYAAEAALRQGQFLDMVDVLFTRQHEWAQSSRINDIFLGYAQQIGLDLEQFSKDYNSEEVRQFVRLSVNDGFGLSVNSTPTFYLDGQVYRGDFGAGLDAAILARVQAQQ